jgi:hypothetical protein
LDWHGRLSAERLHHCQLPVVVTEQGLVPAATAAPTLVSAPVLALMV